MPALTTAGGSTGYGRQQTFSGYRYYRFTPSGSTTTQVARVYFYTGSNKQTVFSDTTPTVTVTNPGGSNPVGEEPANANLSNAPSGSSKWLDFNNGSLIFQFPSRQFFNGYEWYTANDTESNTNRQPTSWTISGSYDNSTYVTLHTANTSSPGYNGIINNSIAYSIRNAWNNR